MKSDFILKFCNVSDNVVVLSAQFNIEKFYFITLYLKVQFKKKDFEDFEKFLSDLRNHYALQLKGRFTKANSFIRIFSKSSFVIF